MNLAVRQKETIRVEAENHAFARRLFEARPILNKKALDHEYYTQKKYKKNLKKVHLAKLTNRSASVATLRPLVGNPSIKASE